MPNVLDRLGEETAEAIAVGDASPQRLNEGDGRNASALARSRANDPRYKARLVEAATLYAKVLQGSRRAALDFQEAMSTSDFTYLFADILDRQMLPKYNQLPVSWTSIFRRGTVRDFRTVKRFTLDGGEAVLPAVPQGAPYEAAALTDNAYSYSVTKWGRRIPLLWEDFINDDLDALRDLPDRLANGARRSEERFATALFASSTGPNSTFFSSGNKNLVATSKPLALPGLTEAFTLLGNMVDSDGAPIFIEGVTLEVPPALEVTARNLLEGDNIFIATGGGTTTDQLQAPNWMRNRTKLIVNPWLPIIDTTHGATAWYLFADPGASRPAGEVGFLAGHETPEIFVKASNSLRVGGGLTPPEEGDFDTDAFQAKVRHVFGGTLMDPKVAIASPGA